MVTAPARGVLVVVVVAAGVLAYRWWNSPERQIRRTLAAISSRLSHDEPVTGLAAAVAAAGLQELVAREVVIEPGRPFPPLTGRDAVVAAAARLVTATPAARVEVVDLRITIGADGDTARVAGSVVATFHDRAGQRAVEAREVVMTLRRVGGRWVVERAAAVNVVEPVT
ncbi:MAG: nuclear transport factor 2 family protein [Vicinamibacterales bacterium]